MAEPESEPLAPHEDVIDAAPMSTALHNLAIEYRYSTGRHYRLTFTNDYRVQFDYLNQREMDGDDAAPVVVPPLEYRARDIRPGLTQLAWILKDANIHVSITVDFDERRMYVAAMMPPNKWEFWDSADILSVEHR